MSRTSPIVSLTDADRERLERWVAAHGTPQRVALRCRMVLAAAAGRTNVEIGVESGVDVKTVALWRGRFAQAGPEGLWQIAAGRGRKPTYSPEKIKAIVQATLTSKPKGMTQWSCRQMAQAQGVSKSTVSTIWRSHNLKPHRVKRFKLSRDARFLEKLTDVVGLYLNPPDQALVLCVDEKTQIQALDRTQPILPLRPGLPAGRTHEHRRHADMGVMPTSPADRRTARRSRAASRRTPGRGVWPQSSQAPTWPPSAAVRQLTMADIA